MKKCSMKNIGKNLKLYKIENFSKKSTIQQKKSSKIGKKQKKISKFV